MAEVDLDKVKTGDRLVIELEACVYSDGSIYAGGPITESTKILAHKPKFDEPKGLGSLAYLEGYSLPAVKVGRKWCVGEVAFYCWEELIESHTVTSVKEGPSDD